MKKIFSFVFMALTFSFYLSPAQSASLENADIVIRGGTIITMDGSFGIIENGAVVIKDGRIVGLGLATEIDSKYRAATVIDALDDVIMPGLINAHTHVPMSLFRGIADDLPLMEWLQKYIFPAEAKNVDEEFVRWGARLGCLEMIRGGTTTYVDMYYFENAIAEETSKAGMRAILGETILDFPAPDNKSWPEGIKSVERFVQRWKEDQLIIPAIAPHAPYTVSREHLMEAHDISVRYGIPLVTHIAETKDEVNTIQKKYGLSPVAYLDSIGFLDKQVISAHVVWPSESDIKTLASRSVGVIHCPQSEMKLASGISPVPKMLRAGINIGLGTDGAASNNDLDLWEEMDTAAKLQKVSMMDPAVLNAKEALSMATIMGARAIHLDKEIGSLEIGKRADIIIVGMDSAHQTPIYNWYSALVYSTKSSDVKSVIINGKVIMKDRKVLTIDETSIRAKALEYRNKIQKSLSGKN